MSLTSLMALGKYALSSLQVNTAGKIIDCALDIKNNNKRNRNIACLSLTLVTASGTAALFVAQPNTAAYFQPIVLSALPFLGNVGSKIFLGFAGFWFGGGLGFNVAKFISQRVSLYVNGHSNTAYTLNDEDMERIIISNEHIYGITDKAQITQSDIEELKTFFRGVVGIIDESDRTTHDAYKYSLLNAINRSNMFPLIEIVSKELHGLDQKEEHIDTFFEMPLFITDRSSHNMKKVDANDDSESDDTIIPMASFSTKQKNKSNEKAIARDTIIDMNEKPQLAAYSLYEHHKQHAKSVAQVKQYSAIGGPSKGSKPLSKDAQKEVMRHNLLQGKKLINQDRQALQDIIPSKVKPFVKRQR